MINKMLLSAAAFALLFTSVPCQAEEFKISHSARFVNNGDGTFSYIITLKNHGSRLTCCHIYWEYAHPSYGQQFGNAAVCAYPGKTGRAGPPAVVGQPSYEVSGCSYPPEPFTLE